MDVGPSAEHAHPTAEAKQQPPRRAALQISPQREDEERDERRAADVGRHQRAVGDQRRVEREEDERADRGGVAQHAPAPRPQHAAEQQRDQQHRQPRPEQHAAGRVADEHGVAELPLEAERRGRRQRSPRRRAHRPPHANRHQRQGGELLQQGRVLGVELELAGDEIGQPGADVGRLVVGRRLAEAGAERLPGEDEQQQDGRAAQEAAAKSLVRRRSICSWNGVPPPAVIGVCSASVVCSSTKIGPSSFSSDGSRRFSSSSSPMANAAR